MGSLRGHRLFITLAAFYLPHLICARCISDITRDASHRPRTSINRQKFTESVRNVGVNVSSAAADNERGDVFEVQGEH